MDQWFGSVYVRDTGAETSIGHWSLPTAVRAERSLKVRVAGGRRYSVLCTVVCQKLDYDQLKIYGSCARNSTKYIMLSHTSHFRRRAVYARPILIRYHPYIR